MTKAESLVNEIMQAAGEGSLVKLSFGKKRKKEAPLQNIFVKPVIIRNEPMLSFVCRNRTNDVTKNYNFSAAADVLLKILSEDFYNADLFTTSEIVYYSAAASGKEKLVRKVTAATPPNLSHDKEKKYLIDPHAHWLSALGITGAKGIVKKEMQHKFRQINKYVEIVNDIISARDSSDYATITDMGSGKGYLTFALYDHLRKINPGIRVTGVELRPELVKKCTEIAQSCGFTNLHFAEGNIDSYDAENTGMLIALHACDTATDDAIAKGVKAGAELIICSPCCHKQIRKQLNPAGELREITRHGILAERQAEMLTDTIRALMLEAYGYKTRIFDFIEQEHTPKNLLIVAEKRKSSASAREENTAKIAGLKKMFGITQHYLETIL